MAYRYRRFRAWVRWKWWKTIRNLIWFIRERLMDFIELLSYGVDKLADPLQKAVVFARLAKVLYRHVSSPDYEPVPHVEIEAVRLRWERRAQQIAEPAG